VRGPPTRAAPNLSDRPRERLLSGGVRVLSDAELLTVLLGTGRRGRSAAELARELLEHFDGLAGLFAAPRAAVLAIAGVGPARWCALQAGLELARRSVGEDLRRRDALASPEQVGRYLALSLQHSPHEVFAVLFLDARNRLLAAEELFRGTLSQTVVYPREVARRALERNAAAVILAHNHPSGLAEPSQADRLLTDALKRVLACLDIPVLDHLIVAGGAVIRLQRTACSSRLPPARLARCRPIALCFKALLNPTDGQCPRAPREACLPLNRSRSEPWPSLPSDRQGPDGRQQVSHANNKTKRRFLPNLQYGASGRERRTVGPAAHHQCRAAHHRQERHRRRAGRSARARRSQTSVTGA
jgi:DNA repair protein RadC